MDFYFCLMHPEGLRAAAAQSTPCSNGYAPEQGHVPEPEYRDVGTRRIRAGCDCLGGGMVWS